MTRGMMPSASSSLITPRWNRPCDAPPLSNRQERPKLRAARFRKRRLRIGGSALDIAVTKQLETGGHLVQVFIDQLLGAGPGMLVERRIGHVAEVAVQFFAQAEDRALNIPFRAAISSARSTREASKR